MGDRSERLRTLEEYKDKLVASEARLAKVCESLATRRVHAPFDQLANIALAEDTVEASRREIAGEVLRCDGVIDRIASQAESKGPA